jgi:DNA (cytosine-5)-methyltransferase 1
LTLRHLDLFSGIGGFSLGLESAGLVETVAFCDFDKYCKKILNKNWPQVPVYDNVKELNYDRLKSDGIISGEKRIDIITGGYPCQPFSVAGKQKGEDDPRHVWPEMFRLIQELRPSWVIGENVAGHIKLGLDTVLENLESEGYSSRTFSISASSVGAVHQRERIWIIAHSNELGWNDRFDHWEERQISHDQERNSQESQSERSGWINRTGEISPTMADSQRMGWSEGSEKSEELEREKSSNQSDHSSEGRRQSRSSEAMADSDTGHGQQQNKEVRPGGNTSDSSSENLADSKSLSSHERKLGNSEEENRQERQVRGEVGRGDGDRNDSFIEDNLADSDSERLERLSNESTTMCRSDERNDLDEQSSEGTRSEGPHQIEGWWDVEPDVGRVAYGVPNRVDRLKCLGNSVVPQIPYLLGVSIRKVIENE